MATTSGSILGNPVLRTEDPRILRGDAGYFDDLEVDGLLHIAFVRSTMAHARVESVDTTEAAGMAGIVAVYTADSLDLQPHQGMPLLPPEVSRPPLARGVVRFVGDIVAAVVAETRAQAVDAAELVIVDYDPLPTVVDPEAALAEAAPVLFPEHGSNLAIHLQFGEDDPTILDDADTVVEGRFVNQRVAPVPMEPNGIVVEPDGDDALTVHVPTQGPHGVRDTLANAVGLSPEHVRVIAPAVGGGFGAKAGLYVEHIVTAAAARALGRPVKWTETRSENMTAMNHGRGQIQYVELGLKQDGTFTAVRARIVQDAGAYPTIGAFLPYLTRSMGQGVYRIPKVEISAKSVTTNTTSTAAYRGAGRPEAAAMIERIVDVAAAELGRDPVELRKQNFLPPDEFPLTTATGANYDVGEYAKALDEAVRVAGYEQLRREQAERRRNGDVKQLGIGVSTYVEVTAFAQFQEFGAVEVNTDGTVTAIVGTAAHGQGHETSYKMIVAELLGVSMDAVRVVQSDTKLVPRGGGTGGSRSLQIGGSALYKTSELVVDKAKRLAAHLLEADVDDVVVHEGGRLGVAGAPATALSWAELAAVATDEAKLPEGMDPGLRAEMDFNQGSTSYPFGAHVAVVEVDTETGRVEELRHVAVDDCGRVLNPLLVTGQQHGGIAQGVSQALYEGVEYDEDGNPRTANLMDYAMPSAAEFPSFEASNTETPTPLNPLGAKGIGESGTIGSTPAVQNAVVDAVSIFGIRHLDMPFTSERVWRAIRDAQSAAG
ncbi:MAG TPA: xanthine dehydrogenase family protein molybdopterin-binding subunit [Acidimicrobiia bacterium]|nr:xanthine dehydrogenase family protein molybdopterin-binding subunit [Acidimicrobiia bacterium]